eukprot:9816440-Lingulodinium_polyedra.AAC.1
MERLGAGIRASGFDPLAVIPLRFPLRVFFPIRMVALERRELVQVLHAIRLQMRQPGPHVVQLRLMGKLDLALTAGEAKLLGLQDRQ